LRGSDYGIDRPAVEERALRVTALQVEGLWDHRGTDSDDFADQLNVFDVENKGL